MYEGYSIRIGQIITNGKHKTTCSNLCYLLREHPKWKCGWSVIGNWSNLKIWTSHRNVCWTNSRVKGLEDEHKAVIGVLFPLTISKRKIRFSLHLFLYSYYCVCEWCVWCVWLTCGGQKTNMFIPFTFIYNLWIELRLCVPSVFACWAISPN